MAARTIAFVPFTVLLAGYLLGPMLVMAVRMIFAMDFTI